MNIPKQGIDPSDVTVGTHSLLYCKTEGGWEHFIPHQYAIASPHLLNALKLVRNVSEFIGDESVRTKFLSTIAEAIQKAEPTPQLA